MNIQEMEKDLGKVVVIERKLKLSDEKIKYTFVITKIIYNYYYFYEIYEVNRNYSLEVRKDKLLSGDFKDPYHPTVFDIGYLGNLEGTVMDSNNRRVKYYRKWQDIFQRVIGHRYAKGILNHTYDEVSIDKRWHCFRNFYDWCENTRISNYHEGFELDKDLLYSKIYGPDTAVFLPRYLNVLLKQNRDSKLSPGVSINKNNKSGKTYYMSAISLNDGKNTWLGLSHNELDAYSIYFIIKKITLEMKAYEALKNEDINKRIFEAFKNYYPLNYINKIYTKDYIINHLITKFQLRKSSDERNNFKMIVCSFLNNLKLSDAGIKIIKEYLDLNIL